MKDQLKYHILSYIDSIEFTDFVNEFRKCANLSFNRTDSVDVSVSPIASDGHCTIRVKYKILYNIQGLDEHMIMTASLAAQPPISSKELLEIRRAFCKSLFWRFSGNSNR